MVLCCAEPPGSEIAQPLAIRETEIRACEPLRILLVEDTREGADLVRVFLAGHPEDLFHIEWISDLVDAMFRLQHDGIDVVLLDLGLPEIDGDRSFLAIKGMTEGRIPIVILTADDRRSSKDLILASGAAEYLTKQNISALELRGALRRAALHLVP